MSVSDQPWPTQLNMMVYLCPQSKAPEKLWRFLLPPASSAAFCLPIS